MLPDRPVPERIEHVLLVLIMSALQVHARISARSRIPHRIPCILRSSRLLLLLLLILQAVGLGSLVRRRGPFLERAVAGLVRLASFHAA